MENGLYPINKLRIILLHLLNINSEEYFNSDSKFEDNSESYQN